MILEKNAREIEKIENRKKYSFIPIEKISWFLLLENDKLLSIYLAMLCPHILRISILLDLFYSFNYVTVISTKSEVCRIREREKAFRLVRRAEAPLHVRDERALTFVKHLAIFLRGSGTWTVVSLA